MTTRSLYSATASEVATAANVNKWSKGWVGYVLSTSTQTFTGIETDVTDLTMSLTIPTGRMIKVSWNVITQSSVDQDNVLVRCYRAASIIGKKYEEVDINEPITIAGWGIDTPSAGTYTYKIAVIRSGGSGTVSLKGATASHEFLVEDIGSYPS